jgi:prepilin-type processing-associated H-X9-DG protein
MFCTRCGKQAAEGARYCAHCGARMALLEAPPVEARPAGADKALPVGTAGEQRVPWRTAAVAIAGVAVVALVGYAGPRGVKHVKAAMEAERDAGCRSNLRQLALATQMYCQDYDVCLPLKDRWADDLFPYIKNREVYKCPSLRGSRCGYAYDPALSGRPEKELSSAAEAVLLFDARCGWNAAGTWDIADPRHSGELNIAFLDGHVRRDVRDTIPANPFRVNGNSGAPPG